jgi:arabinofuranosyltransferase
MSKLKITAGAAAFTIIGFLLFFQFFTFETETKNYSNINYDIQTTDTAKLYYLGQRFRAQSGFNRIDLAIFNPLDQPFTCLFELRRERNGKIIHQQEVTLNPRTTIANIKKIQVPFLDVKRSNVYFFEIKSPKRAFFIPFHKQNRWGEYFKTYTEKGLSRGVAIFSLSLHQERSILSYLWDKTSNHRIIILLLTLLSIVTLYLAARRFPDLIAQATPDERKHSYAIITLLHLALFLVLIIIIGVLVENNTHSRLLGAEDDAFITYKYSENITQGKGFRFNSDEKVLGTTTPLYTMLLAFLNLIFGNIHISSLIVNLISIILSGILVYLLLSRHLSSFMAMAGGLLFIFFPMFYRVLGMETNFLIFLILLVLYLFGRENILLSFFITGLAVLTRIEAFLLVPLLGIWLLSKKKYSEFFKSLGVFILTVLPWFTFSYFYFGNILPNTFYIKTNAGSAGGSTIGNLFRLVPGIFKLEFLKSLFFKGFGSYLQIHIQHYIPWMVLFGISLPFSFKYLLKIKEVGFLLLWVLCYVFAFSVLGSPLFIWYYVLALMVLPIIIILGIDNLLKIVKPFIKSKVASKAALVLIFLVVAFGGRGVFSIFYNHWYSDNMFYLERYGTFRDIADYIKANVPADQSIGMEEIGVIGYYAPNRIGDFYSLVHKADELPHNLDWLDANSIPYLLTIMDTDYVLLNSFRYNSHIFFKNYHLEKILPVHQYHPTAYFYYVLLSRDPGKAIVLGNVNLPKKISGSQKISGWILGTEPVESIEITVGDRVIYRFDTLNKSSSKFIKKYSFNPNAGKAIFHGNIDTSFLENGNYMFQFHAVVGNKRGLFQERHIVVNN